MDSREGVNYHTHSGKLGFSAIGRKGKIISVVYCCVFNRVLSTRSNANNAVNYNYINFRYIKPISYPRRRISSH